MDISIDPLFDDAAISISRTSGLESKSKHYFWKAMLFMSHILTWPPLYGLLSGLNFYIKQTFHLRLDAMLVFINGTDALMWKTELEQANILS